MRDGGAGVNNNLTPEDFAARLQSGQRLFWAIAAGITGDRESAEDIVQESAAIALTKLDEFDPGSSFSAWMSQIVRYCALNSARRTQRRRTTPSADPGAGVAGEIVVRPNPISPRGEVIKNQSAFDDRVASALSDLEPSARACLLLRSVVGLSYKEIAAAMDMPEGTAMSHVHRARRRMREALQQDHKEVRSG